MNSILYKYRSGCDDYLIYDMNRNQDTVDGRRARTFCSQNFGSSAKGVLAGPVAQGNQLGMLFYSPEGEEMSLGWESGQVAHQFLADAGYLSPEVPSLPPSSNREDLPSYVGKVFVFLEFANQPHAAIG